LMLTLLASFAQEEIRSLSDNVKWGTRKRFEKGIPNGRFQIYGYRWEGDHLVIHEEEAKIVRLIYDNYMNGLSAETTEKQLAEMGVKSYKGQHFGNTSIRQILGNITYTGNLLFQKEYVADPISKKSRINRGELPQYFVENTHEAIIPMEVYQAVQAEKARRRELGALANWSINTSCFTSKIKCGQCGGWYGAKVWHSTDKYRRTIYRCNDKFKSHCKTPHLTEDDIKEAFVRAANRLIENKADVLDSITLLKERLTDTEALEEERDRLSTDLNLLADKVQQLIAENARVAQNQDDYDQNYNELVSRYEAAKTQYDKTCEAIQYRKARSRQMDSFIKELRDQDLIKEFDARLWGSLVDFITVYSKDDIRVTFKDGTEIRA